MRVFSVFSLLCCIFLTACVGGSSETAALNADPQSSEGVVEAQALITIPIGATEAEVTQLLGPADSVADADGGRRLWRYAGKRAKYVYASKANNAHALVIGEYSTDSASQGLPLMLTLVFTSAGKVVDFNFAQIAF